MTRNANLHRTIRKLTGWLLVAALLLGLFPASLAQGETSLRIELKGVFSTQLGVWRSIDLSARFEVYADGAAEPLAVLTANPTAAQREVGLSDTLTLADRVASVTLQPMAEDFDNGFVCNGPIEIAIQRGQANVAPVFAYARQGYFALQTLRDDGAAVGPSEYMVTNAEGDTALSFTTDASGAYASSAPLPEGDYHLVQMRAPEGTLPLESAVPFTIATYLGSPDTIAAVRVTNAAAPIGNANVSALIWQCPAQVGELGQNPVRMSASLSGLCDGANTLPLRDFAVMLRPLAFADGSDQAVPGTGRIVSVRAEIATEGVSVLVRPMDASGAALAELFAASGEAVSLEDYQAEAISLTYVDSATQEALTPVGFTAGTVSVEWEVALSAESTPAEAVALDARLAYTFEYPGTDGLSVVKGESDVPACAANVPVSDGRVGVTVRADITTAEDGDWLAVSASADADLANAVLLCELPGGVRVDTARLAESLPVLRLADRDVVRLSWAQVTGDDTRIPTLGAGDGLSFAMPDPASRATSERNSEGASILADAYKRDALLDAFLGQSGMLYAQLACSMTGAFAKGTPAAQQTMLQGQALWSADNQPCEGAAVVVAVDGMAYGALTDANGQYGVQASAGAAQGTVSFGLPDNAACDIVSGTPVSLSADARLDLRLSRQNTIFGQALLDGNQPLADVALTLYRDDASVATAQTDASGKYSFAGLADGTYRLDAALADGTHAALLNMGDTPALDATHATADAIALSGGTQAEVPLRAASLCRVAFSATRQDAPLAGVSLSLSNASGTLCEAVTDSEGQVVWSDIPAGAYTLTVTPTQGTALIAVNGEAAQGSALPFAVSGAQTGACQLAFEQGASISGIAPAQQAGQAVTVASLDQQYTAQTGDDGSFALLGLPAGEYTVYLPLPQDQAAAADSGWLPTQQGDEIWITVQLESGEQRVLPAVALSARAAIVGTAFVDVNLDGARAEGEQPVPGVTLQLQSQSADGAWRTLATQTTSSDGSYRFDGLGAGAYRVLANSAAGEWAVATVGGAAELAPEAAAIASPVLQAGEGQGDIACDVAMAQPSQLTVHAFVDENRNGALGQYEDGLASVRVEVIAPDAADAEAIASGVTDGSGNLTMTGLPTGSYALRVTLPDGHQFTTKGTKPSIESSIVGDTEGVVAISDTLTFGAGQTVEVGVAAFTVGSLSGRVWNDVNGDGLIGDDEPGVAGLEIHLRGERTGDKYTVTSDENGLYCFAGLKNDRYTITATLPEGMLFTRYTQVGNDLRSIYTGDDRRTGERLFIVSGAQNVTSKNIGLIYEGSLSGTAFLDMNYNGLYDDGEPPYPNVTVELIKVSSGDSLGRAITDENGAFAFSALRGSTYRVRVILPDDGSIFTLLPADATNSRANQLEQRPGRRENSIDEYVLANGASGTVTIGVARPAAVMGAVFVDKSYNGLMDGKDDKVTGMTVRLLDGSGNVVVETQTVEKGRYKLEGIMPGVYTVAFQRVSADEAFTRLPDQPGEGANAVTRLEGEWGLTGEITVIMGEDVKDINAGVLPSATISGVFFDDLNDNGMMDEGEGGAIGVSVALLNESGETVYTRDVGADGAYFFDGVLPGQYTLRYQLPAHTVMAKTANGGNTLSGEGAQVDTAAFAVAVGEAVERPLVGSVTLGSFEGVAFHDANANGVMDDGETPLSGVTVRISGGSDDPAEALTGADGAFAITGLRPGSYRLAVELPEAYIVSAALEPAKLDLGMANSAEKPITWEALTNRAAYALGGVKPASITAFLWLDESMDGAHADGEAVMRGLSVELIDERSQSAMATGRTDDSGFVSFDTIRPGSYTLRFALPQQAQPATSSNTFVQKGNVMTQTGIVLAEGQRYADANCGLISRTSIAGSIHLNDAGEMVAQAGLRVRLYQDGGAEPVQTVTTGENGAYRFDGLWPASYVVEVEQPAGTLFVSKQDANYDADASAVTQSDGQNGRTDAIALQMAQHQLDVDVILVKPALVGEVAWLDLNANGLIDLDEPGIPGVTVRLLRDGQEIASTVTDAYGYYLFADVYPGTYQLQAVAYPEVTITTPKPELQIISSCLTSGDGALATSDAFTVLSGERYSLYHLGYVLIGKDWPSAIVTPPGQDWTHGYDYVTK